MTVGLVSLASVPRGSGWAPDGCEALNTTLGLTFCRCWHLTMIAIITDIHKHVVSPNVVSESKESWQRDC